MKRPYKEDDGQEEGGDGCRIRYARSPSGPIAAHNTRDRSDFKDLTCYGCNEPLYYRRDHKRTNNGITFYVKACFTHGPGTGCTREGGNNETYYHRAAKDEVVHNKLIRFMSHCVLCKKRFNVDVRKNVTHTAIEWRWQNFIIDVALFDENDIFIGAVEVYHTHAINTEKREALSKAGIAWVEVAAISILDTLTNETTEIDIMDCAMSRLRCWECETNCHKEEETMRAAYNLRQLQSQNITNREEKIQFGKYNGLSINDIWMVDPLYVRWITGFTGYRIDNKPEINETTRQYITQQITMLAREKVMAHCLICFLSLSGFPSWKRWCASCYIEAGRQK